MCGICGEVRRRDGGAPNADAIGVVTAAMAHRGPDGDGVWVQENVCIGHRRLSIIDLATGDQPMHALDGALSLTYNGEIYNYIELREELQRAGQIFHTTSDTEVLLLGYAEWGVELLPRLNGMFAFALYDWRNQTLFAARDPMGQKPFLYHHNREGLLFSSELAPLMKHPAIGKTLNQAALAHYLVYEHFAAPHTPLEDVHKLAPGHGLLYQAETGELKTWRYWDHLAGDMPRPDASEPTPEDIRRLEEALRGAVARHLRSDVPVGIYLSSGIDSSTMVTLACDVLGAENVRTYTIKHSDPSFDEADQARETALKLGTQHHEALLTPDQVLKSVPIILSKLDEPLADPGLVSIYQVAEFASQHVKVVLSGDGGDEFFCGYPPFKYWGMGEMLSRIPAPLRDGVLKTAIRALPDQFGYMGPLYKAKTFARGLGQPAYARNSAWLSSFWLDELAHILPNSGELSLGSVLEPVRAIHERTAALSPEARLGFEYQQTYLLHNICAHTDKSNMMVSLEARAPFLDTEVMRYVNALPMNWKLRDGQSKYILRQWLDGRLGGHVSKKRKQGFTVPLARWFQNELHDLGAHYLAPDLQKKMGLFNPTYISKLWSEHQAGRVNHYKKLWTLTVFSQWYETHLC